MTVLVKVLQTCSACPSQWDAWDDQGNYWYLRFRHGYGEATKYPSPETGTWGNRGPDIEFEPMDGSDGVIDLQQFCDHAGITLSPDCQVDSVYNHWPYTEEV